MTSWFPITFIDSSSLSTKSLRKSTCSISSVVMRGSRESLNSMNSLCSMSQIAENRGVIFRVGSNQDLDKNTTKRRSFGGSLKRRGSFKLSKSVESKDDHDNLVIERSNTVVSSPSERSFWTGSISVESVDVRNVHGDSQILCFLSG